MGVQDVSGRRGGGTKPVSAPAASPTSHAKPLRLPRFEQQNSLRRHVVNALRAAMMSGEMQSGSIYSAPALAEQFGVSATPVREAMLDLTKEGLVEVVRNKGFRVVHLTAADLTALAELRRLLEVPTVGKLARNARREDLEALRPLAVRIDHLAHSRDVVEYVELDREFHLELLGLSGNHFLVDIVGDLRNRSRLALLREWSSTDELAQNSREHFVLIDQLVAGDAEDAEALIRRHIGRM